MWAAAAQPRAPFTPHLSPAGKQGYVRQGAYYQVPMKLSTKRQSRKKYKKIVRR